MGISQNQAPKVAIIMPAYNMEQYIAESIESVLDSDYPNFEVIIINDGSKDNTAKIAQEYSEKDSRVKLLNKPNGGLSSARNYGIERCDAEFILPVDADDLIEPTYVKRAVEAITSDPKIKIVGSRGNLFGAKKGEWKLPEFSITTLAKRNLICATCLFRREDWARVGGYNEEIIVCEDWAFWIAMLKNGGQVYKLPTVEFHYRIRKNSLRIWGRKFKSHMVKTLNKSFPDFFERELGGRLYTQRTASKKINALTKLIRPRGVIIRDSYRNYYYHLLALSRIISYAKGDNSSPKFDNMELRIKEFPLSFGCYKDSPAHKEYRESDLKKSEPKLIGCYSERRYLLFNKSYLVYDASKQ